MSIKDQRYDRQLRLWGDHGQRDVELSKICVIGSGTTASEILKNLVLPGIGSFTIVDNARVCEEDLGCNFFVSPVHIGKPRAQIVTQLICELNDEVRGNYVVENVEDIIQNDSVFFLRFTVVILTDARERILLQLSRLLEPHRIPLVLCVSVGVIGYLRLAVPEHVIVESHPDSTCPDLRLDKPFPKLIEMADEKKLEDMNLEEIGSTPWLLVIHLFVQQFVQKHGHFPSNYKEKTELRKIISTAETDLLHSLKTRESNWDSTQLLDSFQEAYRAVNTAINPTKIPSEVQDLLEDERCDDVMSNSQFSMTDPSSAHPTHCISTKSFSSTACTAPSTLHTSLTFWRLVRALRDFVQAEGEGQLPVRGSLPDMTSDSARYLRLLAIYQEQFEWAVDRIASRLKQFPEISIQDIRLFVRNAAFLRVVRFKSIEEELKLSPSPSEDLALIPSHEESNDALLWYIVLRSACSFLLESGRWPGSQRPYIVPYNWTSSRNLKKAGDAVANESDASLTSSARTDSQICTDSSSTQRDFSHIACIEADLPAFRAHLHGLLRFFSITPSHISQDYLNEFCRFGGGELHSVAAFMGGIAAQEVIKLITHQFVPIAKPLIYNAITHRTELLEF